MSSPARRASILVGVNQPVINSQRRKRPYGLSGDSSLFSSGSVSTEKFAKKVENSIFFWYFYRCEGLEKAWLFFTKLVEPRDIITDYRCLDIYFEIFLAVFQDLQSWFS